MLEFIQNMVILIFLYVTSFLLHELFHVKSQGLKSTGTIYVDKLGMTASSNHIHDYELFKMSGGILTSIIFFLMVFVTDNFMQWGFLTFGFLHFCYGLFEWKYLGILPPQKYKARRYSIYVWVILIMIVIWLVK